MPKKIGTTQWRKQRRKEYLEQKEYHYYIFCGGANNLAKVLYRQENRELTETIDRYTDGLVFTMQMQEIVETLSAAKVPRKYGKGNCGSLWKQGGGAAAA